MEDYFDLHHQEEAEDALSLCDLPIHDADPECDEFSRENSNSNPSSDQDIFEFFTNIPNGCEMNTTENINFCGKLMMPYEQRDQSRSESSNASCAAVRARSLRFLSSKASPSPATGSFRYTSTSEMKYSRKQVFIFGVPKVPPEMVLSDMRKRQNRRAPAPLFPAVDGGEMVVAGKGRRGRGHWGLLRLLKCRPRSALARTSFGYVPLV